MLRTLELTNIALIRSAKIEFCEGLNVLSGETGAGKSVILDALNFVLGAKADRTMISRGQDYCSVTAYFSLPENHSAVAVLQGLGLTAENEILIVRKYDTSGRGDIRINGQAATAGMLKELAGHLVDIHGQSEHFFLLKESNQLTCLDRYGRIGGDIKLQLSELISKLKKLYARRDNLVMSDDERMRRMDILRFQIDEIENAGISEGEEQQLLELRKKINSREKIISAFSAAENHIGADNAALDMLNLAIRELGQVCSISDEYSKILEMAESAQAELSEVLYSARDVLENFDFDQEEAARCENRLDLIKSIHKKYGAKLSDIQCFLDGAKAEYDELEDFERQSELLHKNIAQLEKQVYSLCIDLTNKRKTAANDFCAGVIKELRQLRMKNAAFDIEFKPYEQSDVKNATENGLDSISFMFSANLGEPMLELSKIISGGEMSRFMLAMKAQTLRTNDIATFVFDEIDAGISGDAAALVAQKFAKIASRAQIIAISHLAQIAAMSDNQLLIEKTETDSHTVTDIIKLDANAKINEISRLLGSDNSTAAKTLAQSMVQSANQFKLTLKQGI